MSAKTIAHSRWALAGIVALAGAAGSAQAQTVTGFRVNPANGNTYYRVGGTSNVTTLRTIAGILGGRLATINDADENQWVWSTFIAGGADAYYIGFNDAAVEGMFAWESGQPVTFTSWFSGEPNDAGAGEDFTVIRANAPIWYDYPDTALGVGGGIVEVDGSDCADAVPVLMGTTTFATLGETDGIDTSCLHVRTRTWFKFVGNGSPVNANTCGGSTMNFDTVIEVFRGGCGALECIAYNDDGPCGFGGLGSSVDFLAELGETYYIAVSEFAGGSGAEYMFDLTIGTGVLPSPELSGRPIYNPANGHSYVLQDNAIPYVAIQSATRYHAFLATVDNAAENEFIASQFPFSDVGAIIGYTDQSTEGAFRWMDGTPNGFTSWAPGEPNNYDNEDFTVVLPNGGWNDVAAIHIAPSVIEFNGDACDQAVPLSIPTAIIGGYTFVTQGVSEDPCAGLAGDVPFGRGVWYRIVGNAENVTVSTCDVTTNFDTTLRVFAGTCGQMRCVLGNDDDALCDAGGYVTPSGRSTLTFYAERGVDYFILVGKYNDDTPRPDYRFGLNVSSIPAPPIGILARSEVNVQTCARYLMTGPGVAARQFDEALALGGDMASIANADENEAVRAFVETTDVVSAYIGLTDRLVENTFAWLDGSPYTFAQWADGEPNDGGGTGEDFVEMYYFGDWNDLSDQEVRSGVVEIPVNAVEGGHIRGGLQFPGAGSAVTMPDNSVPWLGGAYTVECWFRTTSSGVILGQLGDNPGSYVPMIYVGSDGVIYAADWSESGSDDVLSGPVVNNGEWTHVALVRSGFNRALYVDGLFTDTSIGYAAAPYSAKIYNYFIGNGAWTGWPGASGLDPSFQGEVDEFRVWSSERTGADLRSVKDSRFFNPSLYPDLVVSYDMDDAGGSLVFDAKSGAHARFVTFATLPTWTYENRDGDKQLDVCETVCPADIDGNGVVNSTDVSEFINLWFTDQASATINADFNRDGVSNSTDVSDMINAFFSSSDGCM